ncbi:MAG: hypothetical protein PWQ77_866 [Kosmotogales bacterium]|nr:hypothetical protein [Kosmotogales bacterium]
MSTKRYNQGIKITLIGFLANVILTAGKLLAGIFGNSNAMIADGIHSFSDFVSDIVVIFGFRISGKPADANHNYGHGRFETLSSAAISVMLIIAGFSIAYRGFSNLILFFSGNVLEPPGIIALVAAFISIGVKELLYRYTIIVGRKINSQAIIANAWHHRSDAFSSIATSIGIGGAILLGENWRVLDPIASLLVSILIIKTGINILKDSINQFLDCAVDIDTRNEIISISKEVEGIMNLHDLKTRKIGDSISMEFHINVLPELSVYKSHKLTERLEMKLRKKFGEKTNISIHVEPYINQKEKKCIN